VKDNPSVTARIRGGLGNQIFMYAMGRRLSLTNGVPLYLDTQSGFEGDYYRRTYGLKFFRVSGQEVPGVSSSKFIKLAKISASRALPFSRRRYHSDLSVMFDPRFLDLRVDRPIFLDGYWQDNRYFSDIRAVLLSDLTLQQPLRESAESLAQQMRSSESVAIHIRLLHSLPAGIDQPSVAAVNLPVEYLRTAIQKIKEQVRDPKFYLFSDSKSISTIPGLGEDVTRVEWGGDDAAHEDLYLMSQCKHFIIANSTFSWWGAWLGRNSQSIIVTPALSELQKRLRVPEEWHCIELSQHP
jgi:hypothetical protein